METVMLTGQEPQALAWLQERHPNTRQEVAQFNDPGGAGWLSVTVHGSAAGMRVQAYYIVSPTGRVWRSVDGIGRTEPPIRGQSYDPRPRSPR
jgi:hypothetical protein